MALRVASATISDRVGVATPASRARRSGAWNMASISIERPASRSCRMEGLCRSLAERATRAAGASPGMVMPSAAAMAMISPAMRTAASRTASLV